MTGRGNFFAVDRLAWASVCDLGSINAAVAYLVLARGTLADMRTTAWSVNAVETYTGVPRHLAKAAIAKLIEARLIEQKRGGTKPLYVLTHADPKPTDPLTRDEATVLAMVEEAGTALFVPKVGRRDQGWSGGNPYNIACGLVRKGYLTAQSGQTFGLTIEGDAAPPVLDWAWLPCELIDGAGREVAPVELLRQAQQLPALRLLVDLYHAQSLPRYGGVHWSQIRKNYEKRRYGQQGAHTVWGFIERGLEAWPQFDFVAPHMSNDATNRAAALWQALDLLRATKLAAFVPHIIEADTSEATILHPFAQDFGEPGEQAVASFAHEAGLAMLTDWQRQQAETDGAFLVPLPTHLSDALMIGVLRLRYQAGTEANAGWIRDSRPKWSRAAEAFAHLAGKPLSDSPLQHQMDINSGSTRDQLLG